MKRLWVNSDYLSLFKWNWRETTTVCNSFLPKILHNKFSEKKNVTQLSHGPKWKNKNHLWIFKALYDSSNFNENPPILCSSLSSIDIAAQQKKVTSKYPVSIEKKKRNERQRRTISVYWTCWNNFRHKFPFNLL